MIGPTCTHCALPVPPGLVDEGADQQFCCAGCRLVYETIHAAGLDRYYVLRRAVERTDARTPSAATGATYGAMDDPAFEREWVRTGPDGAACVDLLLEGVHCAACAWLVERLPRLIPGVLEARLDVPRRVARVRWRPDRVKLSSIGQALDRLGYPAHAHRPGENAGWRRREDRRFLIRLGVAGACAGNAMLVAFALYGGMLEGMDQTTSRVLRLTGLGLATIAYAWPGRVFLRGALSSLRARTLHMDVPVAIALTAGLAWGAVNTFRAAGEVYFESITAVIFLLLCGRWLQFRQQRSALEAVEALYHLAPDTAVRLGDDGEREVPIVALQPGDRIVVRAGDVVAADGVIDDDAPAVAWDLSLLTGESHPVGLEAGAVVHAGAVALGGPVVIRVEAIGSATRVGRLLTLVSELARERTATVALADRVAHWFVIVVLALAVGVVALWWRTSPSLAVEHAMALLIATCPCALGLATPLAITAAVGRAARTGILVKGGATLERLASARRGRGGPPTIVLDKTGTLTAGAMRVESWSGDGSWLAHVAAVEAGVPHPIARAIVQHARAADRAPRVASEVSIEPGRGVRGRVDGVHLAIGNRAFVEAAVMPAWAVEAERVGLEHAWTPVFVMADGVIVAVAAVGDPVLDDAGAAIEALRNAGWNVRMLSGDHPAIVASVASAVGIGDGDAEGGATPERKVHRVRELRGDGGLVVMVGDGLNDAAALAAADVGVAVHGSAEASVSAADVTIRRPGVWPLVELLAGARRTLDAIRLGLVVSLAYNAVVAALAVAGAIDPIVAAIAMPVSSLTVVTIAWRSPTFHVEATP